MSTELDPLSVDMGVEQPTKGNLEGWRDVLNFLINYRINDQISTTISTGAGTIKMSSGSAATNTAWIPVYYNGTTYWVPAFATNSP